MVLNPSRQTARPPGTPHVNINPGLQAQITQLTDWQDTKPGVDKDENVGAGLFRYRPHRVIRRPHFTEPGGENQILPSGDNVPG